MKLSHLMVSVACAAALLITTTHAFADPVPSGKSRDESRARAKREAWEERTERALSAAESDFEKRDKSMRKATQHAERAAAAYETPGRKARWAARLEPWIAAHHGNVAVRANERGYYHLVEAAQPPPSIERHDGQSLVVDERAHAAPEPEARQAPGVTPAVKAAQTARGTKAGAASFLAAAVAVPTGLIPMLGAAGTDEPTLHAAKAQATVGVIIGTAAAVLSTPVVIAIVHDKNEAARAALRTSMEAHAAQPPPALPADASPYAKVAARLR